MLQILRSQVNNISDFDGQVKKAISALHAHSFTVGVPRPHIHPLIEACLRRVAKPGKPDEYVPDYEIINDPPAGPEPGTMSLEEKKNHLVGQVRMAEQAIRDKLISPRKIRLLQIEKKRVLDSMSQDEKDRMFLRLLDEVAVVFDELSQKAARAEADIDDLTEDNIDSYQIPNFG